MPTGLRWRIMTLQALLVLVLAFAAGFLFYESTFITGTIQTQLAAQKIYFPKTGDAAFTALPAADRSAMRPYAGQQLRTGAGAETYADHYIAVHLSRVAGGRTYSEVSEEAQAHPGSQTLAAEKSTLFQGETLRGILLNAYGWSQLGQYMFFGAIAATVAALVVLGALAFELFAMFRHEPAGGRERAGGRASTSA